MEAVMIPIKIREDVAEEHYLVVRKYLKKNENGIIKKISKINNKKIEYKYCSLNQWVKKITQNKFDLKELITAKPESLIEIKKLVESNSKYKIDPKDKGNPESDYEYGEYFKRLYNKFSSSTDADFSAYAFNAVKLIEKLNLNVCPYCNRNFVTNTKMRNNKGDLSIRRTAQLDHFYPESKYPYLALSFFNLIPVCPTCNKNKLANEIGVSPYEMKSSDEHLIFDYSFDGSISKYRVDTFYKSDKFKKNWENLGLDELYKWHSEYCDDLILRIKIYNEIYRNDLQNFFEKLNDGKTNSLSENDIKRLILGNHFEEESLSKHPLSKLTKDIFKKYGGE